MSDKLIGVTSPKSPFQTALEDLILLRSKMAQIVAIRQRWNRTDLTSSEAMQDIALVLDYQPPAPVTTGDTD